MAEADIGNQNVTTFVANIGDVIRICRPLGYPFFPSNATDEDKASHTPSKTAAYGFYIMDTDLGKFTRLDELKPDTACVYYLHEKSGRQIIRYIASGAVVRTEFYAIVQGITIHDHASVYTGGPAYATYYAELPEEEAEEE